MYFCIDATSWSSHLTLSLYLHRSNVSVCCSRDNFHRADQYTKFIYAKANLMTLLSFLASVRLPEPTFCSRSKESVCGNRLLHRQGLQTPLAHHSLPCFSRISSSQTLLRLHFIVNLFSVASSDRALRQVLTWSDGSHWRLYRNIQSRESNTPGMLSCTYYDQYHAFLQLLHPILLTYNSQDRMERLRGSTSTLVHDLLPYFGQLLCRRNKDTT